MPLALSPVEAEDEGEGCGARAAGMFAMRTARQENCAIKADRSPGF